MATAEPHGHDDPELLEADLADADPGQVEEALECSGDPHGLGLLGSLGLATPNLGACVSNNWGCMTMQDQFTMNAYRLLN